MTTPIDLDALRELLVLKKDAFTIVEGKKDVAALRAVGFTNVVELGRRPLYSVVESIEKGATVQLLVDLDAEGRKLYAVLSSDFLQRGVRIDNELREAIFKTELRQIEGLTTFLAAQEYK